MPQRQQIYRDLLKRFNVDLFVIYLNNEPKAISFGIIYNDTYTTINVGYDYDIRDISKYLVVNQIKRAFDLKMKTLDAGQGDNGWKEHFNLTKIPQYKLTLSAD
jgi:CelD/BcsL family acetyltransferase involved in cellulose biosynthesis